MSGDPPDSKPEPSFEARSAAAEHYVARARRDLLRGSIWTVVTTVTTAPLGFVANVVVARSLGAENLGRMATLIALFSVANLVVNIGWSEATVQWLAAATARGESESRQELIQRCAGFHVFVAGPLVAACAWLLASSAGVEIATGIAFAVWLTQCLGTSAVVMTATARNATAAQIGLVASIVIQVALAASAWIFKDPVISWGAIVTFQAVGPALALIRLLPEERRAVLRPRLSFAVPAGFLTYAVSACLGGLVATLVVGRSEIFVLRFHDLVVATGLFAVATALAAQMTAPLEGALSPLTPIAAGLVAVDRDLARRTLLRALRVSSLLGCAAASTLVPVGVVLIAPLYGASFEAARLPFIVLALVSSLKTAVVPLTAFGFATRSAPELLRRNLVCLAADAALALCLVPLVGLWGAVAANACAQILSLTLLLALVRRKMETSMRELLQALRALGVGLGVGFAVLVATAIARDAQPALVATVLGPLLAFACLQLWPALKLAADEVAVLSGAERGRSADLLLRGLGWARLVRP